MTGTAGRTREIAHSSPGRDLADEARQSEHQARDCRHESHSVGALQPEHIHGRAPPRHPLPHRDHDQGLGGIIKKKKKIKIGSTKTFSLPLNFFCNT